MIMCPSTICVWVWVCTYVCVCFVRLRRGSLLMQHVCVAVLQRAMQCCSVHIKSGQLPAHVCVSHTHMCVWCICVSGAYVCVYCAFRECTTLVAACVAEQQCAMQYCSVRIKSRQVFALPFSCSPCVRVFLQPLSRACMYMHHACVEP